MEQYTEKFTDHLSESELSDIAECLTKHELSLAEVKDEKANTMKSFNESIKQKESVILELSRKYQTGTKEKDVDCYFVFDQPEEGQKTIYRSDTGAEVRVTDMNIFDNPNNTSIKLDEDNSETPPEVEKEFQDKAAQINEDKLSAEQAYNDLPDEAKDNEYVNLDELIPD